MIAASRLEFPYAGSFFTTTLALFSLPSSASASCTTGAAGAAGAAEDEAAEDEAAGDGAAGAAGAAEDEAAEDEAAAASAPAGRFGRRRSRSFSGTNSPDIITSNTRNKSDYTYHDVISHV